LLTDFELKQLLNANAGMQEEKIWCASQATTWREPNIQPSIDDAASPSPS
jgi:hypothetical protein